MLAAPAVALSAAVTLLAILIAIGFAILVARTRRATGIQPPAMSGNPRLERALRVQGNTVEGFIVFIPALWLATLYFQGWIPPLIGLIWCIGRLIFAMGYMAAAEKRHIGFGISIFSVLALVILAGIGVVQTLMTAGAA
ncbi:MAG TPA: MAPEG family protein [Rhizomicrobium sp.]|nr:MAPEG family protein [Rhizomicrobium sp.]